MGLEEQIDEQPFDRGRIVTDLVDSATAWAGSVPAG